MASVEPIDWDLIQLLTELRGGDQVPVVDPTADAADQLARVPAGTLGALKVFEAVRTLAADQSLIDDQVFHNIGAGLSLEVTGVTGCVVIAATVRIVKLSSTSDETGLEIRRDTVVLSGSEFRGSALPADIPAGITMLYVDAPGVGDFTYDVRAHGNAALAVAAGQHAIVAFRLNA